MIQAWVMLLALAAAPKAAATRVPKSMPDVCAAVDAILSHTDPLHKPAITAPACASPARRPDGRLVVRIVYDTNPGGPSRQTALGRPGAACGAKYVLHDPRWFP